MACVLAPSILKSTNAESSLRSLLTEDAPETQRVSRCSLSTVRPLRSPKCCAEPTAAAVGLHAPTSWHVQSIPLSTDKQTNSEQTVI